MDIRVSLQFPGKTPPPVVQVFLDTPMSEHTLTLSLAGVGELAGRFQCTELDLREDPSGITLVEMLLLSAGPVTGL